MRVIQVVPYSESWDILFDKERSALVAGLPIEFDCVHHIGSTSVSGMAAKPVIDILIELNDVSTLDDFVKAFEKLGYECKGEFGIKGRRHYQKGGDDRTHHIHAFSIGSQETLRHLAFRDYLRAHSCVADEYSNLKLSLANTCAHDITLYSDSKSGFVNEHEALSLKWLKSKE